MLERYATRLNLVEINSSFYRPHQRKTYERWAASVPQRFRFSVKVPKSITHELALRRPARPLKTFIEECSGLGPKLCALLVQLPPTLAFDGRVAGAFFRQLHALAPEAQIVCEPRHKSWVKSAALRLLARKGVSRVLADPSPFGEYFLTSAPELCRYWRLHGSPHIYRSTYSDDFLSRLAQNLTAGRSKELEEIFVVFDNTTEGHALRNALDLMELVRSGVRRN